MSLAAPTDFEAKQAIREALQRYARGVDRLDLDMAASAFHPDAQVRHGLFKGPASDWVTMLVNSASGADRVGQGDGDPADDVLLSQQHHLTNQFIELDGNFAFSETYFVEYSMSRRGNTHYLATVGGRYVERYECRDGDWRIIERDAVRDWDTIDPIRVRFPKWEQSPQGRRDRSDPSYWGGQAGKPPSPTR